MARKHSSEAFHALDDPLEAEVFSVLVETLKEMDEAHEKALVYFHLNLES